jgi:hypothetical protein
MYNRRLLRTYLSHSPYLSSESMVHSEAVMASEIGDESCVLDSHIDGRRACQTSIRVLLKYWACIENTRWPQRIVENGNEVNCNVQKLFARCG